MLLQAPGALVSTAAMVMALLSAAAWGKTSALTAILRVEPPSDGMPFGEPLYIQVGNVRVASGQRAPIPATGTWTVLALVTAAETSTGREIWFRPLPGEQYIARVNPCSGHTLSARRAADDAGEGQIRVEILGNETMSVHYQAETLAAPPGVGPWLPLSVSGMCPGAAHGLTVIRPGASPYSEAGGGVCAVEIHLLHRESVTVVCNPATGAVSLR